MMIYEGTILSVDQNNSVYKYLVEEDGIIVYVGNSLPNQFQGHPITHLGDQALTPTFVDTHEHFIEYSLFHAGLNIMSSKSNAQTIQMIRDYVEKTNEKTVICFGASANSVEDQRLISREEIDQACSDRPVMVVKYDGHTCVLNTFLLELIKDKISNLRGYHPDTGEMNQEAFYMCSDYITGRVSIPRLIQNMVDCIDYHASQGFGMIHSVSGIGFLMNLDITLEKYFAKSIHNGFQLRIFPQPMKPSVATIRNIPRIGGCFESALDGCFGSIDAAVKEPYLLSEYGSGVLYNSDEKVIAFCIEANRKGLQIEMHAIGDRAFDQATRALKAALDDYPRDNHRHGIIHASLPTKEGIEICREYNILLSMQSAFIDWPQEPTVFLEEILGKERAANVNPLRTYDDQGIIVSLGSDAPCTIPNPIEWLDKAVNNENENQRVSIQTALRMATYNGYYTTFDEKERGSLEVGKVADMVILSKNPYSIDPKDITSIQVVQTILAGKPYQKLRNGSKLKMLKSLFSSKSF